MVTPVGIKTVGGVIGVGTTRCPTINLSRHWTVSMPLVSELTNCILFSPGTKRGHIGPFTTAGSSSPFWRTVYGVPYSESITNSSTSPKFASPVQLIVSPVVVLVMVNVGVSGYIPPVYIPPRLIVQSGYASVSPSDVRVNVVTAVDMLYCAIDSVTEYAGPVHAQSIDTLFRYGEDCSSVELELCRFARK